ELLGKRRQNAWRGLHQKNVGGGRINVAEILSHAKPRELSNGPCQLNARRASPDDDEVQQALALGLACRNLRPLKGFEHTPPYSSRVFHALEPRRIASPRILPEIAVCSSGRHDEIVIRYRLTLKDHLSSPGVDVSDIAE